MQGFVPYTPSAFRILPGGGAAGRGGGGPCVQGFVSYIPPPLRILPGEAERDAGAGAEGIENVTFNRELFFFPALPSEREA